MDTSNFKKKLKKFLIGTLIVAVIGALLTFLVLNYGSYSTGYRAGIVMKMSKKGFLFKTFEGELNVEGLQGSDKGLSSVWNFSVDGDEAEILQTLDEVALSKERVKLFYAEKYVKLFWRGDTKYLITKVERVEKKEENASQPSTD